MTIKEVSRKFHISQDTLRYYERVGMIPRVTRTTGGIRDYQQEDLVWVELAICMRNAGLPIEAMVTYVALTQAGDDTIPARLQLLKDQKNALLKQRENIETMLSRLDYKISRYETAVKTGILSWEVNNMQKDVMLLVGAGQIGMAIARRMGYGKKIVVGDKNPENAQTIAKIMQEAGFDTVAMQMDLSSRQSIQNMISEGQKYGEIAMLVNAAGVSPSQASVETILKVDLYGTAVLLEEVGKVICQGGVGVTISSQSGFRMPALTAEQDEQLALTPTEELLKLALLQSGAIRDTLHAYQLAKRCNEKRVMAQSVEWGKRGARLNAIAPGIIVTPLAIDEFNGIRGDFYKNMFAKCPAGRPGTADEVANVAELIMSEKGAFITGSTFLVDGGATASYYYGELKPEQ